MSAIFLVIAIVAGLLTVLAPCILPLLPIVIGSAEPGEKKKISKKSLVVIGALSLSVIVFTLLLKATTLFIAIPASFWQWFSGVIIILVGLALLFPGIWARIPFVNKLSQAGNKAIGTGYQKKSYAGDALIGVALGPVFTTCSPTYLFIIATILPSSFASGFVYLIGFTVGLAIALLAIAYFGQALIRRVTVRSQSTDIVKKIFAIIIIIVGIAILTGYDKKLETAILDSGYGATINFEEGLIKRFDPLKDKETSGDSSSRVQIPRTLQREFPDTDWSNVDERIEAVVSGGPGKDGIPSIDSPVFSPIANFPYRDSVQAVVLRDGNHIKAYPYNILTWHEIVNDVVDGQPVAVTFCPLCGSALVFDREIDGRVVEFGVSGFLRESNMIMYDRQTDSLWQQSIGESIAGSYYGLQLEHVRFQLMTVSEIRQKYPDALILSEDTGYQRNYNNNPYAGYEETESFIFGPSKQSNRFHPKEIFTVLKIDGQVAGFPQKELMNGAVERLLINERIITAEKKDGEISITDEKGNEIPFYFEMWFSFFVQHGEEAVVLEL